MKIVNIIQRYPPAIGGSETWCEGICKYMSKQGCNVEVLTLNVYNEEEYWREPPLDNCILKLGKIEYDGKIKITRYKRSLFFRLGGPHSFEMYFKMIRHIKNADIVNLHTLPYFHNFIGYLVVRMCRKKVVIIPHFHPANPLYERKINYWLLKKCDFVLAVSAYEKKYLTRKGIDARKIFVVGNGIDPRDYQKENPSQFKKEFFEKYKIREETKIIIFIGRKIEYKGIDTLIEAIKQIMKNREVKLFLIGPRTEWFKGLYSELTGEEKNNIIDLGVISQQDKTNLLYLSDLLVLPSKYEAFGIVFLEAWICGIPVIGIEGGATSSVIGNSGLTFKYGDVNDLREKIEIILNNSELARNMAIDGKNKLINNYTWEKVGKKVFRCYHSIRKEKLKILIVSSFFPPHSIGGAEIVAFDQAGMLKKLGHEVMIFCGKVNNLIERYKFTCENGMFKIIRVNLHNRDVGADSLKLENVIIQERFRKLLFEFSPDIVHFHNMNSLPAKIIDETKEFNIPTVMTLHDYWPICIKNIMVKDDGRICQKSDLNCMGCKEIISQEDPTPLSIRNYLMKMSYDKIDLFISPSRYLAEVYISNGFPLEKISIIRYGIDIRRFENISNGRANKVIRFGFVGYMGEHKGIEYLIRAFSITKRDRAVLYLVGEGERLNYYKNLCCDLKLVGRVRFIKKVDSRKIQRIYKKIDVFVLPSIWPENYPVSIIEAMASRIPVLASDIGGIPELVKDNITGWYFEPGNAFTLAQKIQDIISHPEKLNIMGENAFNFIREQHNIEQVIKLIEEKYWQTINTNSN